MITIVFILDNKQILTIGQTKKKQSKQSKMFDLENIKIFY